MSSGYSLMPGSHGNITQSFQTLRDHAHTRGESRFGKSRGKKSEFRVSKHGQLGRSDGHSLWTMFSRTIEKVLSDVHLTFSGLPRCGWNNPTRWISAILDRSGSDVLSSKSDQPQHSVHGKNISLDYLKSRVDNQGIFKIVVKGKIGTKIVIKPCPVNYA